MIHVPTSISPRKNRSRGRETENTAPEIHRAVHEMVNHLTVMNLCCFKIREALATRMPAESLSDIADIEAAVEQMAAVLNDLTKAANINPQTQTMPDRCSVQPVPAGSRSSNNVYPLFKR